MEVLMENLVEQELIALDNVQLKIEHKNSLPDNAKKLIGVTCQLLGQNTQIENSEIVLTGNLVTRLVYVNEFDKFDSEDVTETFEKKVIIKDHTGVNQLLASASLINNDWRLVDNKVVCESIILVNVQGVKAHDLQVVGNLTGEVEVRKDEHQILSFSSALNQQFEISENIQLDATCEGVLGVNVNPNIKDVVADNGKVNVKGVLLVNVLGVKNVENNTVPYNASHEIDFAKSITMNGITNEDLAYGVVSVDGVKMHIENNHQGAVLVLSLEIKFSGSVYTNRKFSMVSDAISFDKELTFKTTQLNYVDVLPQVNTTVDIENNINLAPNTPYISHVVAVDSVRINDLHVSPADGKTLLEGIMVLNLMLENEEHVISGDRYEVPFQTYVRMEKVEKDCVVNASVVPLMVNVKARRGTELLVDAQLGVTIQAGMQKTMSIVNNLEEGQNKVDDGSAIRIYIIGEKENLWDLAKRTNLSCASLLQQNPNLENGCTPGERIVVYRHEKVSL